LVIVFFKPAVVELLVVVAGQFVFFVEQSTTIELFIVVELFFVVFQSAVVEFLVVVAGQFVLFVKQSVIFQQFFRAVQLRQLFERTSDCTEYIDDVRNGPL
jgi:hypothetical protein